MHDLRDELRQCKAELEAAARLLRPVLPRAADAYEFAALRVAKTLASKEADAPAALLSPSLTTC